MNKTILLKRILILTISFFTLYSCGNTKSTVSASNNGFPSASVKCGSEACVK